jgi:hypothetical protein
MQQCAYILPRLDVTVNNDDLTRVVAGAWKKSVSRDRTVAGKYSVGDAQGTSCDDLV